jgi:alpha-N-arabinofuranosidase
VAADDILSFAVTSRLAVGSSLLVKLESDTYQTDLHGEVPTVDAVATHDPETGQSAIFVVNRGADMQRPRSRRRGSTG